MSSSLIHKTVEQVKHLPNQGGDTELSALLTLSDGTVFNPPKALNLAFKKLKHAQQILSRKFKAREETYNWEYARLRASGFLSKDIPSLKESPYSKRLIIYKVLF